MAEFPALPLWTDAYLGDTTHLTTLEHGAYMLLLMAMWRAKGCKLPNNDKMLSRYARLSPAQWKRISPVILDFFSVENDSLVQHRLTDEINRVKRNSKKATENVRARWLKTNNTSHTDVIRTNNGRNTTTSTPITTKKEVTNVTPKENDKLLLFDEFWKLYPRRRRGGKSNAEKAYRKALSENRATEQEILEGVTSYAQSDEGQGQYAKGCAPWLNDDRWSNDYTTIRARTGSQGGQRYAGNKEPTSRAAAHREAINQMEIQQGLGQGGGRAYDLPDTSTD